MLAAFILKVVHGNANFIRDNLTALQTAGSRRETDSKQTPERPPVLRWMTGGWPVDDREPLMDLPAVRWQEHAARRWRGLDPRLREEFTSLQEVEDVFSCSLSLTTQDDVDVLQSVSADRRVQKDGERAAACRATGNVSFRSRDYAAAARLYSQGVCLSPLGSEQLSLCFANRSAALFHLQLYQDSLEDIDRALKNNYPSHLSHKLEDRRSQCLKLLSEGQRSGEEHHRPATKTQNLPHGAKSASGPFTSGLSPGAAVGFSLQKGRHLVATEGIAAGEVVLQDRPYSCVLIPGMEEVEGRRREPGAEGGVEERRCHRCLAETRSPVACDGCSYSRYCSTRCQRDAWEEHHRWECPLGAELMAAGVMSQLALRVALKAGLKNVQRAREPITEEHADDSYRGVFHLQHHLHRHSPGVRFLCALTAAALYLKLCRAAPPPASWAPSGQSQGQEGEWSSEQRLLGSAVLRHMLQLRCNAQAVTALQDTGAANSPVQSSREIRVATAIFPTLSLMNHSCCPNTSLVFSTGPVTVGVRAAKAVSAGEEILHCYGPHSSRMVTQERRRLLQEQYYFLCECEACSLQQEEEEEQQEEEGGQQQTGLLCGNCKGALKRNSEDRGFSCPRGHRVSSSEASRRLQEIRVDLQTAVDLMETERPEEALRLLRGTQSPAALMLAETHPVQGELEDATARAHATMGDWSSAAAHLERSAAAVGSQYGEDSIELGRQLFKLAQLHFNGGARSPALAVIPKVRRLLRLHGGPRCPELQELQAMEDCLRG